MTIEYAQIHSMKQYEINAIKFRQIIHLQHTGLIIGCAAILAELTKQAWTRNTIHHRTQESDSCQLGLT